MAENLSIDQIQENFCQATNILIQKQLEALQFDITIEATIIDASKASMGTYSVSTGQSTFVAYSSSDVKYKKDDKVMITIPQGNYDNQKMIIGKCTNKNTGSALAQKSPFENLIDITGNLYNIQSEEQTSTFGIVANNNNEVKYLWDESEETATFVNKVKLLNQKSFWDSGDLSSEDFTNYDYVGLKVDFSTLLGSYNTISGNYGLIIEIYYKNNENDNTFIQLGNLDSSNFFGNIYNSNFFQTQEAIFDIAPYKEYLITQIKLYAYQRNNFKDSWGELIYPYSESQKEDFELNIEPNILIKNPYICLGISSDSFTQDIVKIITKDNMNYCKNYTAPAGSSVDRFINNKKVLNLHWIHQDEKTGLIYKVPLDDVPEDCSIRWYRYKLGAKTPDQYIGAHWVRFYGCAETPDENGDYGYSANTKDIATNKIGNINFYPNVNNQNEKLRVVIIKKGFSQVIAVSPIIEFINDDEISSDITILDSNALSIRYEDNTQGNYFLYDKTGTIVNSYDKETKQLTILFGEDPNINNKNPLDYNTNSYSYIKWTVPADGSMIMPLNPNTGYTLQKPTDLNSNEDRILISEVGDNDLNKIYYNKNSNIFELEFNASEEEYDAQSFDKFLSIQYKINKKLDYGKSRNSIFLEARIDGKLYSASAAMLFGTSGTSGSEYTIVINWDNSQGVFDIQNNIETPLTGWVELLDPDRKVIEQLPSGASYSYKWISESSEHLKVEANEQDNSKFIISALDNLSITNDIYILQIDLKNFGDYTLTTYYPLPLKQNVDNDNIVSGIDGPTMVRYASDGTVNLNDNNPYIIQIIGENSNNIIENGYWQLYSTDQFEDIVAGNGYQIIKLLTLAEFKTGVSSKGMGFKKPVLKPIGIYTQTDSSLYAVQFYKDINTCLWSQPIYIYQDVYPSATLNNWDGKSFLKNDEDLTLVARGFAAGKKNEQNQFSGVILGDWSETNSDQSITTYTGVYGLSNGAMSYAFRDNGTAFLGTDEAGRIEFDGNNSIIQSAGFTIPTENNPYSGKGTKIDLRQGSIQLFGIPNSQSKEKHLFNLMLNCMPNSFDINGNFLKNNLPLFQVGRHRNIDEVINSTIVNDYLSSLEELQDYTENCYNKIIDLSNFYSKVNESSTYVYPPSQEDDNINTDIDINYDIRTYNLNHNDNIQIENISNLFTFSPLILYLYSIFRGIENPIVDYSSVDEENQTWKDIRKDFFDNIEIYPYLEGTNFATYYLSIKSCLNYLSDIKNIYKNNLWDNYENLNNYYQTKPTITLFLRNLLALKIISDYNLISNEKNPKRGEYDYEIIEKNIQNSNENDLTAEDIDISDYEDVYKYIYNINSDYQQYKEQALEYTNDHKELILKKNGQEILMPSPIFSTSINYSTGYYLRYAKPDEDHTTSDSLLASQMNYNFRDYSFNSTTNEYVYEIKSLIFTENNLDEENHQIFISIIDENKTVVFEQFITIEQQLRNTPINIIFYRNGKAVSTSEIYNSSVEIPPEGNENGNTIIPQCIISKTSEEDLKGSYKISQMIKNNINNYHSSVLNKNNVITKSKIQQFLGEANNSYIWDDIVQLTDLIDAYSNAIKNIEEIFTTEVEKQLIGKTSFQNLDYSKTWNYPNNNNISKGIIILKKFNVSNEEIYDKIKKSITTTDVPIDNLDWDNDLIKIEKNGGYITSYDYRPTMAFSDKITRLPTDNQENISDYYSQGMKGFIIDFTNNRFVLGNNSSIQGYQTQFYPGQQSVSARSFQIGTGVNFKLNRNEQGRDLIGSDNNIFIKASANTANKSGGVSPWTALRPIFYITWDGDVYLRGNLKVGKSIETGAWPEY